MIGKKTLKRLKQLFAMLGSSNAQERETARAKLDELLVKNRKTWNDLTELLAGDASESEWNVDEGDAAVGAPTKAAAKDFNVADMVLVMINDYVDLKPHEAIAATLWTLHTHVYDRFMVSPRLLLTSPVRGCGKTTLLSVLELLASRSHRTDSASAAGIYWTIERDHPTLLIDEADNAALHANLTLKAVLNAGHRVGGKTTRVIRGAPKSFSVFGPMALAAIGTLPLPLLHRGLVIHMERTAGREDLLRFDLNAPDIETVHEVYRHVCAWARSKPKLNNSPTMPKGLRNRQADNWRPLLAIADSFGAEWSKKAREAARIFRTTFHDEDAGVILLGDIKTVFDALGADHVTSELLVKELLELVDGCWNEYQGKNDDQQPRLLRQADMARLLRPFGITPKSIWPAERKKTGASSAKGYRREQFLSAWERYCSGGGEPTREGKVSYLFGDR
ncbi:MAG: DUF3631 domain-containing protein [Xanthobacteraceae bacterium]